MNDQEGFFGSANPVVYEYEHPVHGSATFCIRWRWEGTKNHGFFRPQIESIEFDLFCPQAEQEALVAELTRWAAGQNDDEKFRVRENGDRGRRGPNPLGDLPHRRKNRLPNADQPSPPLPPRLLLIPEKEAPPD